MIPEARPLTEAAYARSISSSQRHRILIMPSKLRLLSAATRNCRGKLMTVSGGRPETIAVPDSPHREHRKKILVGFPHPLTLRQKMGLEQLEIAPPTEVA